MGLELEIKSSFLPFYSVTYNPYQWISEFCNFPFKVFVHLFNVYYALYSVKLYPFMSLTEKSSDCNLYY